MGEKTYRTINKFITTDRSYKVPKCVLSQRDNKDNQF